MSNISGASDNGHEVRIVFFKLTPSRGLGQREAIACFDGAEDARLLRCMSFVVQQFIQFRRVLVPANLIQSEIKLLFFCFFRFSYLLPIWPEQCSVNIDYI